MIPSRPLTLALLGLVALSSHLSVEAATVQKPGLSQSAISKQRAAEIREAFKESYGDYRRYAFGFDEVKPLSKKGATSYGGWGATVVDALSTAHVMGHEDIFSEGVDYINMVDFSTTRVKDISLFETNIRYLGGILSAYELDGKRNRKLLAQASVIGDRLLTGWVGNNDIPYNSLPNWNSKGKPDTSNDAGIAEAGTLILEFDRLSKFTGEPKYLQYAERAMRAIINSPAVFPGLYGQNIRPNDNMPTSDYVTWGGGSDSFFEYLIKYAYLIGTDEGPWIPTWISAVKSSIKHLITKPDGTSADVYYLTDYSEQSGGVLPRFSHLGCFVGGNWILGAKILGIQDFDEYGLRLTEGCINTYTSSPTGIGPESFVFVGAGGNQRGVTINNERFYREHGFDFEVSQYILRPEVLESVFYAYRTTGDERWQELAWKAWQSIQQYCKAPAAYAALAAVNSTSPQQLDNSQSFFYAETFKYLYLTFADPEVVNLDEYVFTTEAHLFKVDVPDKSYHSELGIVSEPEQLRHQGPEDGEEQSGQGRKAQQGSGSESDHEGASKSTMPVPAFSSLPGYSEMRDNTLGSLMDVFGGNDGQRGRGDDEQGRQLSRGHLQQIRRRQVVF